MQRYGSLGLSKPHLEPIIGVILSQFNQSKRDWGVKGGAVRGCERWSNMLAQMLVSWKIRSPALGFSCCSHMHFCPGLSYPVLLSVALLGLFEITKQCWSQFESSNPRNSWRSLLTWDIVSGKQTSQTSWHVVQLGDLGKQSFQLSHHWLLGPGKEQTEQDA